MNETSVRQEQSVQRTGGLEGTIDILAWCWLIIGCIATIAWFGLMVADFGMRAAANAAASFLSTLTIWAVLRAIAEHLRLQKKIAGVAYGGKITAPYERDLTIYRCEKCGHMLYDDSRCDACGAEIAKHE